MSVSEQVWTDVDALVDAVIEKTNGQIRLATPLGLGKANHFINALYAKIIANSELSLKIYTGLTLQTPQPNSDMERRFVEPLNARLYDGYEELTYARDLQSGDVPDNVEIAEFFFAAGDWLGNAPAQQQYVSANYSDAGKYILADDVNVVAQMVATENDRYSLSCNPDITLDFLDARAAGDADFIMVGEINHALPFMGLDANVSASELDFILDSDCVKSDLFAVPKRPVGLAEYAAGFHASALIPDGGTLQIGIGSVGDAVAHALILRHKHNAVYKDIIAALNPDTDLSQFNLEPFEKGLFGVSEMLVDTFLDLMDAGVVAREVEGVLVHGGFFVGPQSLYERLRNLPKTAHDKINMTRISFINDAHANFEQKQTDRAHARFINNGMKATLMGAVVSDGLENGQVISGVGGQFDFVRQGFALKDARSIIMIGALRENGLEIENNIVWSYGHITIPRHMRDIIITEYGVADLRGKSDAEVITEMISVADSRYHEKLIETAIDAGKLTKSFEAPKGWTENSPDSLKTRLTPFQKSGHLPDYPFGTDFTLAEQTLIKALDRVKTVSKSKRATLKMILKGFRNPPDPAGQAALERMNLHKPRNFDERFKGYLLRGAFIS